MRDLKLNLNLDLDRGRQGPYSRDLSPLCRQVLTAACYLYWEARSIVLQNPLVNRVFLAWTCLARHPCHAKPLLQGDRQPSKSSEIIAAAGSRGGCTPKINRREEHDLQVHAFHSSLLQKPHRQECGETFCGVDLLVASTALASFAS